MHRLFLVTFTCTVLALATVIASVGLWVDPFAFFTPVDRGFRRESAYTLNRSLFRTVEFRKLAEEMAAANRQINVIVGDSIGNQIDSAPVEQITGETWFNYSYGQATLAENISLLEDLIDGDYPIKRIVWSLAFPRVRDGGKNEMARSLEFVDSPAWHLFTFKSLRGVYYVLRHNWFGIKFVDRRFDMEQAELVAYMNQRLQMDLKAMSWPAETLAAVDAAGAARHRQGDRVFVRDPAGASAGPATVRRRVPRSLSAVHRLCQSAMRRGLARAARILDGGYVPGRLPSHRAAIGRS